MLAWLGTIVLPDGTQFAERGEASFVPGHRIAVAVRGLASGASWEAVVPEATPMRDLPWDDWTVAGHLFVGTRNGVPVRHSVALAGCMVRSVTTRLDTGLVTQAVWRADASLADWCALMLAGIDAGAVSPRR